MGHNRDLLEAVDRGATRKRDSMDMERSRPNLLTVGVTLFFRDYYDVLFIAGVPMTSSQGLRMPDSLLVFF